MTAMTPKKLTTYKALAKDLESVRKNGFAIANEEHVPGLFAVAAMVRGESGPIASIALIGRELEPVLATADKVMHTAEVISHRMDRAD